MDSLKLFPKTASENADVLSLDALYSTFCTIFKKHTQECMGNTEGTYIDKWKEDEDFKDDVTDVLFAVLDRTLEDEFKCFVQYYFLNHFSFAECSSEMKAFREVFVSYFEKYELDYNANKVLQVAEESLKLSSDDDKKLFHILTTSFAEFVRFKKEQFHTFDQRPEKLAFLHENYDSDLQENYEYDLEDVYNTDQKREFAKILLPVIEECWSEVVLQIQNSAHPCDVLLKILTQPYFEGRTDDPEFNAFRKMISFLKGIFYRYIAGYEERVNLLIGLTEGNKNIIVPDKNEEDFKRGMYQFSEVLYELEKKGKTLVLSADTSMRTLSYVIRRYYPKYQAMRDAEQSTQLNESPNGEIPMNYITTYRDSLPYHPFHGMNDEEGIEDLDESEQLFLKTLEKRLQDDPFALYAKKFKECQSTESDVQELFHECKDFLFELESYPNPSQELEKILKEFRRKTEYRMETLEYILTQFHQLKNYLLRNRDVRNVLIVDRILHSGETMFGSLHILGCVVNELKASGEIPVENEYEFSFFTFAMSAACASEPNKLDFLRFYQFQDEDSEEEEDLPRENAISKDGAFCSISDSGFPFLTRIYSATGEDGYIVDTEYADCPNPWKMSTTGIDKTSKNKLSVSAVIDPEAREKVYTEVDLDALRVAVHKNAIGRLEGRLHNVLMTKTRKALVDWIGQL